MIYNFKEFLFSAYLYLSVENITEKRFKQEEKQLRYSFPPTIQGKILTLIIVRYERTNGN